MPIDPHPDDATAEICVLTGEPAHARVRDGLARGWYGSTVADMSTYVVLGGSIPEGPVSDGVLRRAIASGQVYDADSIVEGRVALADVPDEVVLRLVADGVRSALHHIEGGAGKDLGVHVPPDTWVDVDDPLTIAPARALLGRCRGKGADLFGLGSLAAMALRARGLPAEPGAVAARTLERLRRSEEMTAELLSSLGAG